MSTMLDLTGKKAVVTGGTRGLGRAMAEGLMENGAEVVLWGTSEKALDVAGEFSARGFLCHGVAANLADREALRAGFARALDLLGGQIDILVNGAGIQSRHPCEDFPPEDLDRVLAVNLSAPYLLSQLAGREMLKRGYGRIINIASMTSFFGSANSSAYAASKGGVAQMTRVFCTEWAGRGITVNAIAPGYMATDMNADTRQNREFYERVAARIPARRWGTPEDMKGLCVFLASDASAYVNGAVIPVDGGYLCNG